jgi:hypothetical protein
MKKLTRRQLATQIGGSAAISFVAARAMAQDWDKAALQSHKENSEALAKFEIPMSTEPAFLFKA